MSHHALAIFRGNRYRIQMRKLLIWIPVCFLVSNSLWAAIAGRVVAAIGEVKIGAKDAHVGDEIAAGQQIRTGASGAAKLLLADKSIVDLAKNTLFTVENSIADVGSYTKLDFGMVRSSIQKRMEKKLKFQMRTKTSVLAVRGTEFVVNSQGDSKGGAQDQVTVRDGQVAVGFGTSSATKVLNAGDQLMTMGKMVNNQMQVDTGHTTVTHLKPEAVQAVTSEATTQDRTFVHRVEVPASGGLRGGGDATLSAAAANVVQDLSPNRGPASSTDSTSRPPPPPPPPVGTLNSVDQSAAQNKVAQGVALSVTFNPNP